MISGRAEAIWPDRLVLEPPDRQIDTDKKMNAIWHLGPCRMEPRSGSLSAVWFSGRSGFCVCLGFVFSRVLSPSENNLFSKLWRAPDRFDFPTEPDPYNFLIGPDRLHFPIVFYVQHHENWVMLILMYLSIRPFNDPSLPAVIESSFGFPSMHSSVNHMFVAPTYPLMQ